ncbi:TIGR03016 family PEP-CTERM system-associated outer membrane protein [Pseudorhodoferax sp.]|uniref:TIGR03016 family PEP-CTERM system-associated outer membrane protein n=1 Tax=Pseudorhodoferax sp. TaxID=1993553 RepID=UPI002DD653DC|nr:TIGR03016 family PEP-CTERM system-associated outer membrane protein [Pseudorhodoferax sp.]
MSAARLLMFCLLGAGSAGTSAQAVDGAQVPQGFAGVKMGSGGRAWLLEPRVSTDVIWSDNAKHRESDKRSEFTTTVSPGLRLTANGQRLTGNLDYRITRVMRAQDTSADQTQQSLRSTARLEAIEDRLFVDYSGSITQRTISAFGQQTDDPFSDNPNRTEVRTFQLSPYLQGRFGDLASYRLRYSTLTSRSKATVGSDQDNQQFSAGLSGLQGGSLFNWSVDANRHTADYKEGREVEADQLRAVLGYRVIPELNIAFIPGWESNNYASVNKDSRLTWGVSADWAVERTRLSAVVEDRFFGRSHAFSLTHRTQRTAWRLSDNKNVNVTPEQFGRANVGVLYDVLFLQFESIEPDPVRRAILVESFLAANGLNGQTPIDIGFQSSGASLQRRQDMSATWIGLRESVTFVAAQSRSSSLFNTSSGFGDLTNSSFVRQQSFSLSYARRLRPGTSMNVLVSRLRSLGSQTGQSTTMNTFSLSFSTQLGEHMSASIGLRRSDFDSPTSPYTENSIRGGLSVRF